MVKAVAGKPFVFVQKFVRGFGPAKPPGIPGFPPASPGVPWKAAPKAATQVPKTNEPQAQQPTPAGPPIDLTGDNPADTAAAGVTPGQHGWPTGHGTAWRQNSLYDWPDATATRTQWKGYSECMHCHKLSYIHQKSWRRSAKAQACQRPGCWGCRNKFE